VILVKIDWKKIGTSIWTFIKKYWWVFMVGGVAIYIGYKFGWDKGLITGVLGGSAGTADKVFKSNQENRKKRAEEADKLMKKAKGTKLPLIILLVVLLVLGSSVSAAPGTVPMDEYLKVVDTVSKLKEEVSSLNERLNAALQAADLYRVNWEEAEADLVLSQDQVKALEQDKLVLIKKISDIQNRTFGVQAFAMYDGELRIAVAGTYKNFLLGATYSFTDQVAGVMAGFHVDF